jgi:hypothetical protein
MDCRNTSGNDNIGGVKLSPSTQSGEYPKGEGVVSVVRLLRPSPEQSPPTGNAVLPHPPSPRLRWTRDGSAHISFEKNDAALTLFFVIAGLVPAIHHGPNVICDCAPGARFALHSCCTMDCRNKSGNDSIGGVKLSPSTQSGGTPSNRLRLRKGGGRWCGTTDESEPGASPPPGVAILTHPPAPRLRWTREGRGALTFRLRKTMPD